MERRGLDETPVAPGRGADVEAPPDADHPAGAGSQEQDAALFAGGQGLGLDHAGVVDGRAREVPRGRGRQEHVAARRADRAAVGDEGVHRTLLEDEADDAAEGKGDAGGGREADAALAGRDRPFVHDLGRDQDDETAMTIGLRHEVALVDDGGGAAPREGKAPGHEVGVRHREGGRHEAPDVDLRGGGEQDPVGIEQEDPPIGRERAPDDRGVRADDAVEEDGVG